VTPRPLRATAQVAAYTALLYAAVPFTAGAGLRFVATPAGSWIFGRGLALVGLVGGGIALGWLRQVQAPRRSYVMLVLAAVLAGWAFWSLAARPLERIHVPEYAVAAWLAHRALRAVTGGRAVTAALAFLVTAAIGLGEEMLQSITPGRYFAWHDVGVNVLGGTIGLLVIDAVRVAARGSSSIDR
jgi:hypothetical protein